MNLEDIFLGEISHTQKNKYYMINLYEESKIVKLIEAVRRTLVTRNCGKEEAGSCWAKGMNFQLCKMTRDLL